MGACRAGRAAVTGLGRAGGGRAALPRPERGGAGAILGRLARSALGPSWRLAWGATSDPGVASDAHSGTDAGIRGQILAFDAMDRPGVRALGQIHASIVHPAQRNDAISRHGPGLSELMCIRCNGLVPCGPRLASGAGPAARAWRAGRGRRPVPRRPVPGGPAPGGPCPAACARRPGARRPVPVANRPVAAAAASGDGQRHPRLEIRLEAGHDELRAARELGRDA